MIVQNIMVPQQKIDKVNFTWWRRSTSTGKLTRTTGWLCEACRRSLDWCPRRLARSSPEKRAELMALHELTAAELDLLTLIAFDAAPLPFWLICLCWFTCLALHLIRLNEEFQLILCKRGSFSNVIHSFTRFSWYFYFYSSRDHSV